MVQSRLSVAQASSSFKHLDTRYATPTFGSEVLHLVP